MAGLSSAVLTRAAKSFKEALSNLSSDSVKSVKTVSDANDLLQKTIAELAEYTASKLEDFDEQILAKEVAISDLNKTFEELNRTAKVSMELDLKEFGLIEANKFVKKLDKMIIDVSHNEALLERIDNFEVEKQAYEDAVKLQFEKELSNITALLKAESSAKVAELEAKLEAQINNNLAKDDVIDNLRKTVDTSQAGIVKVASKPVTFNLPSYNEKT